MHVSDVVCLRLYAYRFFKILSLLLNLVSKEPESEIRYIYYYLLL